MKGLFRPVFVRTGSLAVFTALVIGLLALTAYTSLDAWHLQPPRNIVLNVIGAAGAVLAVVAGRLLVRNRRGTCVEWKKIHADAVIPQYAHKWDAGFDFSLLQYLSLAPGQTSLVKTGLQCAVPPGYMMDIRPRSGNSLKTKLRIANSPGTIDSSYRGEIGIIVENIGSVLVEFPKGAKIAQGVILKLPRVRFVSVDEFSIPGTSRGSGGFGSTS